MPKGGTVSHVTAGAKASIYYIINSLMTYFLVNSGSGKGLLPADTKPLPETMLIYH